MNAVAPGLVDTPVTETWAARYATGQVLLVGGGLGRCADVGGAYRRVDGCHARSVVSTSPR